MTRPPGRRTVEQRKIDKENYEKEKHEFHRSQLQQAKGKMLMVNHYAT